MTRRSGRVHCPFAFAIGVFFVAVAGPSALAQTVVPVPSYENSVHVLFDAPGIAGPDDIFNQSADAVLSFPHGPYARLGVYTFMVVTMPWTQDTAAPVLSSPRQTTIVSMIERARSRGLMFHVSLLGGMSRGPWTYNPAFLEDRRNAQWYGDGELLKTSPVLGAGAVWATPSRYARKLRRHMESKTRETARLLVSLRKAYPETFLSASGDGEAELNFGGLDTNPPYEAQIVADYSPFAVLEFRDWILHAGLYADGEAYAGQGFGDGGPAFQGDAGLAAFNAAYGTSFTTWSLRYFDWSLDDPVDGDPGAIPALAYQDSGWSPMPESGAAFIDGGFDAPRAWGVPSAAFYALWLRFREEMVHHYVEDFSDWILTTPDDAGTTFEPERWFTHQIPADYLEGTYPGTSVPNRRLFTSASTFETAFPKTGRMGLTIFDTGTGTNFQNTSSYLVPEIERRKIPSWGLMEYSPLWPNGGDVWDVTAINARIEAVVAAGAHVINFHTWPHLFSTGNAAAFKQFLQKARYLPRDRATTHYVLPRVRGLRGDRAFGRVNIHWRPEVFFGNPEHAWTGWPGLDHFAIWRGGTPGFSPLDGERVGQTTSTSFADGSPDPSKPFYRVVPFATNGFPGEISASWAQGFFPLSPCRAVDTRESAGSSAASPALAPDSERVIGLAGKCGIPENASAVSVNLTVADATAVGYLQFVPADIAFTSATSIHYSPAKPRANNSILYLATDDTGAVKVRNNSTGTTHLIIDVNGYFQ